MQQLTSINDIERFINDNEFSFLYLSKPDCSVCVSLLPQVQKLLETYPKIKLGYINTDEVEAVAGRFSVFTIPVLLLFVNGKEYIREARIVHLQLLDEKINKIYENMVN